MTDKKIQAIKLLNNKRNKGFILYAIINITEQNNNKDLRPIIELAISGGIDLLQIRDKKSLLPISSTIEIIRQCRDNNIISIINDNPKLAIEAGADGVHLGQEDIHRLSNYTDKLLVGISCHNKEEAIKAKSLNIDYIGSGAVFGSSSKLDTVNLPIDELRKICQSTDLPVFAIGGITSENIKQLKGTGISGVAVISAIFDADNITEAARTLKNSIKIDNKPLSRESLPIALTIAGSDSSGGAGIQADIKTMLANDVYAMSIITAITAQNTKQVSNILEIPPNFVEQQIKTVFDDIVPDAVKIGMLGNVEQIKTIAKLLKYYMPKNIVIDPVMVSTSGSRLISIDAEEALGKELFSIGTLITPNIDEAEILSRQQSDIEPHIEIKNKSDMERAAKIISQKYSCNVLVKGGHMVEDASDCLCLRNGEITWFNGEIVKNSNTHGTGCTLSSAIASELAKGNNLKNSIKNAKIYISQVLHSNLNIGMGSGPLDHGYILHKN